MIPALTNAGHPIAADDFRTVDGKVWFWSHDHPVREEATWPLADDFDTFLSTFHEIEP